MPERNEEIAPPTSVPSGPPLALRAAESLTQALQRLPEARPTEEEARARIAWLEREAKALGADSRSAVLFHEIGLLWEDPLANPRNAAVAFQNAYRLAPDF